MYNALLFVHLLGVALLVGSVTTTVIATLRAQTAATVAELRTMTAVTKKVDVVIGPAMLLILGAGLYMVSQHGDDGSIRWSSGWVDVSLAIFAVMSVLGPTVESGHAKRVLAAAQTAPDGGVTGELDALRRAPLATYVSAFGASQIIAFLYLMTNKPGLGGALLACAVAAALSAVAATLRLRAVTARPASIQLPQQAAPTSAAPAAPKRSRTTSR